VKEGPSSFYPEIQNEEAWLPSYVEAHFSARAAIRERPRRYTSRFTNYKKFRVESVIVSLKNKK
jgi:hypothetical protein